MRAYICTAAAPRTPRFPPLGACLVLVASWCWSIVLLPLEVAAQRSPFNGLEVLPADSNGHYRILLGGHFHGSSSNISGYPAATLLANLDTINALGANLFLSTGDLFMDPVKDRPRYDRALFSKLKMPFFNAPGNHDIGHEHAPATTAFRSVADQYIVLNTEAAEGGLAGDQLNVLGNILDPRNSFLPSRVFIVSHRPIWSEDEPRYSDLFRGNTRSLSGTNFEKDVYPILEKIAEHAQVFWISGSMGGMAPASIFFQEHAPNITFIQCAIRDLPRDALLIADVYTDSVTWSALSLTGQKLMAPEAYNAAWWREHIGKPRPINWRLLPYLVKTTVLDRAFWWGAGSMLLIGLVILRLLRRASS